MWNSLEGVFLQSQNVLLQGSYSGIEQHTRADFSKLRTDPSVDIIRPFSDSVPPQASHSNNGHLTNSLVNRHGFNEVYSVVDQSSESVSLKPASSSKGHLRSGDLMNRNWNNEANSKNDLSEGVIRQVSDYEPSHAQFWSSGHSSSSLVNRHWNNEVNFRNDSSEGVIRQVNDYTPSQASYWRNGHPSSSLVNRSVCNEVNSHNDSSVGVVRQVSDYEPSHARFWRSGDPPSSLVNRSMGEEVNSYNGSSVGVIRQVSDYTPSQASYWRNGQPSSSLVNRSVCNEVNSHNDSSVGVVRQVSDYEPSHARFWRSGDPPSSLVNRSMGEEVNSYNGSSVGVIRQVSDYTPSQASYWRNGHPSSSLVNRSVCNEVNSHNDSSVGVVRQVSDYEPSHARFWSSGDPSSSLVNRSMGEEVNSYNGSSVGVIRQVSDYTPSQASYWRNDHPSNSLINRSVCNEVNSHNDSSVGVVRQVSDYDPSHARFWSSGDPSSSLVNRSMGEEVNSYNGSSVGVIRQVSDYVPSHARFRSSGHPSSSLVNRSMFDEVNSHNDSSVGIIPQVSDYVPSHARFWSSGHPTSSLVNRHWNNEVNFRNDSSEGVIRQVSDYTPSQASYWRNGHPSSSLVNRSVCEEVNGPTDVIHQSSDEHSLASYWSNGCSTSSSVSRNGHNEINSPNDTAMNVIHRVSDFVPSRTLMNRNQMIGQNIQNLRSQAVCSSNGHIPSAEWMSRKEPILYDKLQIGMSNEDHPSQTKKSEETLADGNYAASSQRPARDTFDYEVNSHTDGYIDVGIEESTTHQKHVFHEEFDCGSVSVDCENECETVEVKRSRGCDISNMFIPTSDAGPKKYCCMFCNIRIQKLERHLRTVHKNEKNVKEYLAFPPGSAPRRKIITKILKQGEFVWNNDEELNNDGEYAVRRRPNKKFQKNPWDKIPCPRCLGAYSKSYLRRHWNNECGKSSLKDVRGIQQLGRAVEGRVHPDASEDLERLFTHFTENENIRSIRFDWLVICYGNDLCLNHSPHYQHVYICNKLRAAGRVLSTSKSISTEITDMASLFHVKHCNTVIDAIRRMGKFDQKTKRFGSPGTASTTVTLIIVIGELLVIEAMKLDDTEKERDVERFLKVFKKDAKTKINRLVSVTKTENRRHKKDNIPTTSDVNKLGKYLDTEIEECFSQLAGKYSYGHWLKLSQLTMASILIYNRRRAGEMQNLLKEDFEKREIIADQCDMILKTISKEAKQKIKSRIMVRNKLGKTSVPVLLKHKWDDCLELLVRHRQKAGIPTNNPFLFALPTHLGMIRTANVCTIMRSFSVACGAENPSSLRGTNLRKHLASFCTTKKLSDNDISNLADFMGHAEEVHRAYYRTNPLANQVGKMSFLLDSAQGNDSSSDDEDNSEDEYESNSEAEAEILNTTRKTVNKNVTKETIKKRKISLTKKKRNTKPKGGTQDRKKNVTTTKIKKKRNAIRKETANKTRKIN